MTTPITGQIYRHRKHSPDHWHEYEVVGIVEPWPKDPRPKRDRTHWIFENQYRHTTTGELMTLTGCARWIYADVTELHVAYRNTRPDLCDPDWVHCLRPLIEFVDGRFKVEALVEALGYRIEVSKIRRETLHPNL